MKNLLLVIIAGFVFITGCKNEPAEGDVLENKLTRARIKIDKIGVGRELRDLYNGMNEYIKETTLESSLKLYLYRIPVISDEDTLSECISFEDNQIISAGAGKQFRYEGKVLDEVSIRVMKIIPLEELESDYIKIE